VNFLLAICAAHCFLRAAEPTDIGVEQKRFYLLNLCG